MNHESSKQISLHSSLQPYHTTLQPASKDVFLQFFFLDMMHLLHLLYVVLMVTFTSPSGWQWGRGRKSQISIKCLFSQYWGQNNEWKIVSIFKEDLVYWKDSYLPNQAPCQAKIHMKRHKFINSHTYSIEGSQGKTLLGGDIRENFMKDGVLLWGSTWSHIERLYHSLTDMHSLQCARYNYQQDLVPCLKELTV